MKTAPITKKMENPMKMEPAPKQPINTAPTMLTILQIVLNKRQLIITM